MTNFTQKYSIIQLLENMPEGTEFPSSSWPLHITIAAIFAVDWNKNDLHKRLQELLAGLKPVAATADHDEFFGPKKQTQVTVLKLNEELISLHYKVVELLEGTGAVFNEPQFNKEGFRAHVTVQKQGRINEGDVITCDALTVVDMFPNNDPYQRKLLKTMSIGK